MGDYFSHIIDFLHFHDLRPPEYFASLKPAIVHIKMMPDLGVFYAVLNLRKMRLKLEVY